ncbi:MAG: CDP-2,3-bis-(O-geranylgeranyl)-sn-glycerol synthase [Candidatus Hermodarchaeota archaeon]
MSHPILLLLGFWYILPAYVANGFAVFAKFFSSPHPIDGGRVLKDERYILGPGKSWEGFFIGFISGVCVGLLQVFTAQFLEALIVQYLILPPELVPIVLLSIPLVIIVALGALVGDLFGSFVKRRMNISRGRPAPLLDQLDFLILSIIFGWFIAPLPLVFVVFLLIVTPLIHLLANIIGYLLGLKKVPW